MKEEDIRKKEIFNKYLEIVKKDVDDSFEFDKFVKIQCPACESDNYEFQFSKNRFNYVVCQNCNTLFVNPRPRFDTLEKFYESSPSSKFWVKEFFMPVAEARREKIFKPRAKFITERFSQLSRGKIGDIGAGFGLFLEELKKIWPESALVAIEPSVDMADICRNRGLEVCPRAIENVKEGEFDLLTSFELFEHLYEPKTFAEKAWELLKPGGHLVLTTLSGEGFDIQVLWEKSKSVSPPHHLNFFNPTSIKVLLEKVGFNIESIETPGKLDWDIVENMHVKEKVEIGRLWKLLSTKSESVKESFQKWISKNNLSSHMRVIAFKK